MPCPCETRTSTWRSFATISSGLYRFLAIAVLLDVKDIPQVGPLQWGWISLVCCGSADLSPPPARGTVFTLFWCCLATAPGSTACSQSADVFAQVSSAESNDRVAWHMCHTPNLSLSDRRRMESRTAPAFARPYVIFGFSYRSLTSFSLPRLREWLPPVRRNPAERRAPCWRSIRYQIQRPAG